MPDRDPLQIDPDRLAAFCRRWSVRELAVFGSVLRDDFRPDSDVDVMVAFDPDSSVSYFDWPDMQDELSEIFAGRRIDLVERKSIRNPFIRHQAFKNRRVMFAA